ncbi:hypothetical protein CALVIDRAFT_324518 [Calocera viscosa TUFC12733]|uniref:Uncharacterized protein n=1 Tax=Calocera viscosa (strain TUFC12733) TaxID=1330018 RepID=A0A167QSP9_CALVF|nr:hypothetical protein CALVIDRAFT_324518 [Calocera viscosa TUFC12733]
MRGKAHIPGLRSSPNLLSRLSAQVFSEPFPTLSLIVLIPAFILFSLDFPAHDLHIAFSRLSLVSDHSFAPLSSGPRYRTRSALHISGIDDLFMTAWSQLFTPTSQQYIRIPDFLRLCVPVSFSSHKHGF